MMIGSLKDQLLLENSIQVVVPSTAQLLTEALRKSRAPTWYFTGNIVGGEPWNRLVYDKASKSPGSVYMTPSAARSLRYHLPQVESHGVVITDHPPEEPYEEFSLSDVHWERIKSILQSSGYQSSDVEYVLLACQDHGEPDDPTQSSRDFRMRTIYSDLASTGKLDDLLKTSYQIPSHLPRHQALAQDATSVFRHLNPGQIYVMDSSPAVVLGTTEQRNLEMIINVGNGHTLVVFLTSGIVDAVYETHTGGISTESLLEDIELLLDNSLSHEKALARGGHGIYQRSRFPDSTSLEDYIPISLIGPRREKIQDFPGVQYKHPIGNMMMAGPFGMYRALSDQLELD